jgi:hypothetical protein
MVEALCWGIDQLSAPETEAKFITKSRCLELLPGRIPSAEYKAWICTADDCFNMPQYTKSDVIYSFSILNKNLCQYITVPPHLNAVQTMAIKKSHR